MGRRPANYRKITRILLRGDHGNVMYELFLKYKGRKVTTRIVNHDETSGSPVVMAPESPIGFAGVVTEDTDSSDSDDSVSLNPIQNVMAVIDGEGFGWGGENPKVSNHCGRTQKHE